MQSEEERPRDLINDAMGGSILERPSDPLQKEYLIIPEWLKEDFEDIKLEYDCRAELKKENLKNANRLLFTGPPGTGKTIMSRYLADELGMEFYQVRSDRMVHSLYGYEERVMGKLWDELQGVTPDDERQIKEWKEEIKTITNSYHNSPSCRHCGSASSACACTIGERLNFLRMKCDEINLKNNPKVVLMDEIEMFALSRGKGDTFKDKALTILLERLEAFRGDSIFIGATNMGDKIDPAMWRRFDKVVEFKMPDATQRDLAIQARLKKRVKKEEREDAVTLSHGLSFSELRMAMDKALKRSIVKEEEDLLGKTLRMCVETEVSSMRLRKKGHLHQAPTSGFRKQYQPMLEAAV